MENGIAKMDHYSEKHTSTKNLHNFWFPKAMKLYEDILKKLIKSNFQCHQGQAVWNFHCESQPVLVKTGQKVNSLSEGQLKPELFLFSYVLTKLRE
jgi:hypothetical protein